MTAVAMTIIHPWKGIGQARDRTADRCSQVLYAINRTTLALQEYVNPLTDVKILDQTKLKAFTDDKLYVTKIIISVFDRVENIVGRGEIACTSNFSFSHNVFKKLLSQRRQKVSLCGNGLNFASNLFLSSCAPF